jgi:Spy/CpxP family protein refolding chaperone
MALRLFEACWKHIPAMYNRLLDWVVKITSTHFSLERTRVLMRRTTIADDEVRKQLLTQLMAANQISPQTALEPYDIDATDEVRKVYQHMDLVAKIERESQEDQAKSEEMGAMQAMTAAPTAGSMAAAQQGAPPTGPGAMMGGMPVGGMPGGAGGGQQATTLTAMSEQAAAIAQQLVSMPEYDRKQQLRQLRESNRDLHSLVTAEMERIRSGARSQGQQMLLAQPPAGG